ncbi:MFS transporter [Streptomyces sp. NPDC018019]|uniref:MFS transporter n=1 Tax=Streptomyces sp. NPDC018019 TaxID=3365030 RepID=UPI0037875F63
MRPWAALVVLLCGTFLANLDVFIVVVAMPALERDLGADGGQQQLVLAGYQLVYALGLAAGGRLGDALGPLRVFGLGMAVFTGASVACGAAPVTAVLVVARMVQGAGTALMVPQVYRAAQTLFTGAAQRRAYAAIGAVMGLGAIGGQLLGGWLLSADVLGLGWRAVFLVNVPVGVLALTLLPWAAGVRRPVPHGVRSPVRHLVWHRVRRPVRHGPVRADLPGIGLAAGALGLFVVPLVAGGAAGMVWWGPACLAASVPVAACFLRHERALDERGGAPLVPPVLLGLGGFRHGIALIVLVNCGLSAFVLTLGLLLQRGFDWSPLATGAGMAPAAVAFAAGSLLAPRLARGAETRLLVLASIAATASYAGCAAASLGDDPRLLIGAVCAVGAALGLCVTPALSVTLRTVPDTVAGAASGVVATAQQLGAALGVCVFGFLFFAQVRATADVVGAFAVTTAALTTTSAAAGVLARDLPRAAAPAGRHEHAPGTPTGDLRM